MIEKAAAAKATWADRDPLARIILRLVEDEPGIHSERIVRLLRRAAPEDQVRETLGLLEDTRLIERVFGECYPC